MKLTLDIPFSSIYHSQATVTSGRLLQESMSVFNLLYLFLITYSEKMSIEFIGDTKPGSITNLIGQN